MLRDGSPFRVLGFDQPANVDLNLHAYKLIFCKHPNIKARTPYPNTRPKPSIYRYFGPLLDNLFILNTIYGCASLSWLVSPLYSDSPPCLVSRNIYSRLLIAPLKTKSMISLSRCCCRFNRRCLTPVSSSREIRSAFALACCKFNFCWAIFRFARFIC